MDSNPTGTGRPSLLLVLVALCSSACVGIGGETIDLGHEPLAPPGQTVDHAISLQEPAIDGRAETSRIGRATFTVFAITSGAIRTNSPIEQAVIPPIQEALAAAGYTVERTSAQDAAASGNPALRVTIEEFHFSNYNWFFPIVPTWGDIGLKLELLDSAGAVAFSRSYAGSGNSFCLTGSCAFSNATEAGMTEVLEQIVTDATSDDFLRAYEQAGSAVVGSAEADPEAGLTETATE